MTPRATWSPRSGRMRTLLAAGLLALLALVLAAPSASAAPATLTSITTVPESPSTCDSVTLVVSGTTPTPCYEIVRAELDRPVELPTMGPIPAYEIRVRLTLRETLAPDSGACPTVVQPYEKTFELMRLRFGSYWVHAVEYLIPAGSNAPRDSSTLSSTFDVDTSEGCPSGACVLLGFGPASDTGGRICHASAPPGGRASLPVTLVNPVPVGGVQTTVIPFDPRDQAIRSVRADSHVVVVPVAVETTDRTAGFQIAWIAEGSRARVLLYSASGAEIAPGRGPIFRVIYQVSAHAEEQTQFVGLAESIVADPHGDALPLCPTIALAVDWGRICIVRPGCDLDGNGTSDILDVVQLVNCALAGPGSEACPDSVAARADCNEDGSIDVRDVICCVRKILGSGEVGTGGGGSTGDPTRIGFAAPVRWVDPLRGLAELTVTPGAEFAGIDFGIDAASSGARIAGLRLEPGSGYRLEWSVANGGATARAMLLSMGEGSGPATILVDLTPALPAAGGGVLSLAGARSATRLALPMPTELEAASAPIPEVAAPQAPSVAAARPNPFRDETEIAYALPVPARATLRVYSASGRLVRTLVDSDMPAGVHVARWDGKDSGGRIAGSGIYFFRFSADGVIRTHRMLLLR